MEEKKDNTAGVVSVLDRDRHSDEKEYPIDDKRSERDVRVMDAEHEGVVSSDLVVLAADIDAIYDRAIALSVEETTEILEDAWLEHHDDPNFPSQVKDKIEYFLSGDSSTLENYDQLLEEMKIEAGLIRFSSPYPEVRAVVKATDDYNEVASTFRVWVIGTMWCGVGSFINQFFSLRTPTFSLSTNEVQLLSYPLAKFMEYTLPTKTLFTFRGYNFTLNPGRFTEKEHMLITIMANVGMLAPYSINVLIVQQLDIFYGQKWAGAFGYQILTGLSIQMIGMGFAGMTRRFIVYPEHCIWLLNLATIALNKSFHSNANPVANGWRISRFRFFMITFAMMFCWYWLPGSLVQCISYFNWISWINPNSVAVNAVFGSISGLGLNPIPPLDWSQWYGSTVLVLPFFSTLNQFIGMFATAPIILGFWYGNVLDSGYLPLVSNRIFNNKGKAYNVSMILDSRKELDYEKYTNYSQPYMAASNVVLYTCFFAAYSAVVVHTLLYHRKEISNGFKVAYKSIRAGQKGNLSFKDWHNQTMAQYDEVPEWWYLIFTVCAVVLGVLGLTLYPTNASVSAIFFGIALCILFVIPIGIITSITGAQITLNVFAEFIGGLIYPGNALAMNYFKSYGVVSCMNAIQFAQDLKLGHYMKIGQRYTFIVQVYGSIIACCVATSILNWQMTLPKICELDQPQHFYCNGETTFFTATVFWGTLGPTRIFGKGGMYAMLLTGFAIGAFLPIPFWLYSKKYPRSIFAKAHVVVMLYGALAWNPYSTLVNYWPGVVLAYIFQVHIKRKYLAWWSKYNYILAVGFGSAIPLCAILIFGVISSTKADETVSEFITNTISFGDNCDAKGCRAYELPEIGYIGPTPGPNAWI